MTRLADHLKRALGEPRYVVSALRVLVLAALALRGFSTPPASPYLYWVLVLVYAGTIFGYLWSRNSDFRLRRITWLVFLFDVGMVSALILLLGDRSSEFLTAYLGLVLMAAIAEGVGHAVANAIVVALVYTVLTSWGAPLDGLLTLSVASVFVFFLAIALFMGHLVREARDRESARDAAHAKLRLTSAELKQSTDQLRAAREALRANDRLATLGMLSAGIAHEIKSPLAAIVGNLDPARDVLAELRATSSTETDVALDELDAILEDCDIAAVQLRRVALDLTSMASGASGEIVSISPCDALRRASRMLRSRITEGFTLHVENASQRRVRADAGRVLQVLLNLAGNALDAMEDSGGGVLRLAAVDVGEASIAFVVSDTGPGMSEEVRASAFTPFFTTKAAGRGTGLGLHVVSEIAKAQRGTIEVESCPGEGTTMRVVLPAERSQTVQEKVHADTREDPAHRGRRGVHPPGLAADAAEGAVSLAARS